jgi:cation diffusion facilitator family transporter
MSHGGGQKAIIAALLANLGVAIAKFVGFLITSSASLLAESVHSVADSGNQALLLLGGRRARKAATAEHPFGYGRERYFWAFAVALVLFSLGSMFAIYEGINKLRHPHDVENLGVALGILGFAMVLEGFSLRTAVKESRLEKGGHRWSTFIRRSRSPELPVVLLEDLGALIGLVLAFVAVLLAQATGEPAWDGIGTLSIGLLLGVIAVILAVEMKSLLIGESALPEHRDQLLEAFGQVPVVERVIHMKTQHLGPDELLVAAKVAYDKQLTMSELSAAIDTTEEALRAAVPIARVIYIEPDIYRDPKLAPEPEPAVTTDPTPTATDPAPESALG